MTLENKISKNLGKAEELVFRARQIAGKNNNVETYGMLDDALLLIQGVSMALGLKSSSAPGR